MARSLLPLVLGAASLTILTLLARASARPNPAPADRAAAFLATLTEDQRKRTAAPFASGDREDWHYVPRRRAGVAYGELNTGQRAAFEALLAAAMSADGLAKAKGVLTLEGVLVELGADPDFRDPGRYHVRVFGDPKGGKPWGFSFEGHHLSLNYTSGGGALVAVTPAFFGANPHRVPRGKRRGLRVLGSEEGRARALLASLPEDQRNRAILAGRAPREIVTGARNRARLDAFEGLPASAMDDAAQKRLRDLVALYARNHRTDGAFLRRVDKAGFAKVHFAWAGGTRDGEPHYYRVHGPTFVIEYVNVGNGANHSHTVLRDFENDFGRDWLAEHLGRDHAGR